MHHVVNLNSVLNFLSKNTRGAEGGQEFGRKGEGDRSREGDERKGEGRQKGKGEGRKRGREKGEGEERTRPPVPPLQSQYTDSHDYFF